MSLISSEIKEQGVGDEAIIYINLEESDKRKIKTAEALEKLII